MADLARLEALIGRPYEPGADGPEAFDCYGLVRHVLAEVYGETLPPLARPGASPRAVARAVLAHPERAEWQQVDLPADGDLVLMGNVDGRDFHLGVHVVAGHTGLVLHADTVGVVADDVVTLPVKGFHNVRFFRRS